MVTYKHILFFVFVLVSSTAFGQYTPMTAFGYQMKRVSVDSTLHIPSFCGVPTLRNSQLKNGALAMDTCNNKLYKYTNANGWSEIAGGGGSGTVTSVATGYGLTGGPITTTGTISADTATLSGKYVRISDTSGMLAPYLNGADTISISSRINGKIDSLKRNPGTDSVFAYKNNQWVYQFKDSTGGGVSYGSIYDTAGVVVARVRNIEATTLQRGEVVYIFGSTGNTASVKRANNKQDSTSSKTFGIVRNPIIAGDTGIITTQGQIEKLNLGAYSEGDILWLDSVDGKFTKTKPSAPYHQVFLGVVERANNGNGLAYIKVQNGYELNELHNVSTNGVANNDVLMYESSTKLWKNKSVYVAVDTTSLSSRIDQRIRFTDSASMLTPYLRKIDTASISTRINTKLNISDTTVFERKSSAAFTFHANNTNGTANMTDQTFREAGLQTYSSTITWTGTTAPSGTTNHSYNWQRIGNMVTLNVTLNYGTAGSALTAVSMVLPADCPTPREQSGLGAASEILYFGNGQITTASTASNSNVVRAFLRVNAADNGYELVLSTSSGNYKNVFFTVQYFAN